MSAHDEDNLARHVNRYGSEVAERPGTPGRSTVTARMPASARSIARAVMAEMSGVAPEAGALVARAAEGGGHALPGDLRARFESSLGTDLGGVRVHTDSAAAEASHALGARAFATGQDVFMGAGQYAPHSSDGAFLLAHEVAHTVQQRGASSGPQMKLEVSAPGDAMETEADAAAVAMMSGLPARVSPSVGVARRIARTGNEEPRREAPEPAGGEHEAPETSVSGGWETPPRTFHITSEESFVNVELEVKLRGRLAATSGTTGHLAAGANAMGQNVGTPAPRDSPTGTEIAANRSHGGASVEQAGILRNAMPRFFDGIHPGVRDSMALEGGPHGVNGHLGLQVSLGEHLGQEVQARFNLVRRSGEEHPRLEFASLTLSTTVELGNVHLDTGHGTVMAQISAPVDLHISPNWTRIGRYLLQRFGVQVATDAAATTAATGGAGAAAAPTGAAGGGGGAGGGGAGAAETGAMGGGAEAAIDLAISAGFVAGAIITIAATIGSLVEIDDADDTTRRIPGVAGALATGFMLGLEGHDEPGDRTQAVGWERGDAERTRIVESTAREHPGTRPEDYAAAVTELARTRYQALHAQARQRFWRLAQAIVWHGYARRQTTRHALEMGWRYIWQGADDPEVQRLYHQYADRL